MRIIGLGLSLMLVVGCASMTATVQYGSLESAFYNQLQLNAASIEYPAGKQGAINSCVAKAMVQDIPADDQARMLQAINTKQADEATNDLFIKWMGRSLKAGPSGAPDENVMLTVTDPSSANPTVQFLDSKGNVTGSPTATARILDAGLKLCPDIYSHYPQFFQ